jgi:Nucleotidyl transferase AbiEii toxin, Type IV TA system
VTPYVASFFPELFAEPHISCCVLKPDRTFWEKVTALHAESFRDDVPRFFSRHYSDVAVLSQTDMGEKAMRDRRMLDAVRRYKQRYYASARARYDLAVPGTLRLIPSRAKLLDLTTDYRAMRTMFFIDPPPFSEVLAQLQLVEAEING